MYIRCHSTRVSSNPLVVNEEVLLSFDSINFAVPTNKFFARLLERSQWSQLKLHSSEMVLTRNFSKQQ